MRVWAYKAMNKWDFSCTANRSVDWHLSRYYIAMFANTIQTSILAQQLAK